MKIKEYIEEQFRWFKKADDFVKRMGVIKYYIILFIAGFLIGGIGHLFIPATTEAVMEHEPIKEINNFWDFWINNFIFMIVTAFVAYGSPSLVGISFIANGFVVGNLAIFGGRYFGVWFPIIGFLPHGIFEIPAIFLIPMIAIKFKEGDKKGALKLLGTVVILMLIAGVIEYFVTGRLLDWYVVNILGIEI